MALELTVNGERREIPELNPGASLGDVIAALGLTPDRIAVERNGSIAQRSTWDAMTVDPMDRLEIVHFVGGGTNS